MGRNQAKPGQGCSDRGCALRKGETGEYNAVRAELGRGSGWKLEVSSGTAREGRGWWATNISYKGWGAI